MGPTVPPPGDGPASVAAVVAVLALVELAVGVAVLVDLGPAWAPTTALTALMGVATAAGLLAAGSARPALLRVPAICFGLAGVLVLVAFGERLTGTVLLGDVLAVEPSTPGVEPDERTSLVAVVAFALLAGGVRPWSLDVATWRRSRPPSR